MYKVSITKEELAQLDKVEYTGNIYVVDTVSQAKSAISHLRKYSVVGFDTETRPSFKKGVIRNMALIQIATHDDCFLFRVNKFGIPDVLMDFLEDESIIKVGLSIKDDFGVLRRTNKSANPNGFVELQNMANANGISDKSLQKIYAILFGRRISKGQRLSNWEAPALTVAQQGYAALDAWSCLKIYEHLSDSKFIAEKSRYYREVEEPNQIKKEQE